MKIMKMSSKFFAIQIAALLALLFSATGCNYTNHPALIGSAAPDFTVNDPSNPVHLANYRGKVVLVNFWASWCGPCVEEWPSMVALQERMPQITILAIDQDDNISDYTGFLETHPPGKMVLSRDAGFHAADLYGTHQFPETFVVDRNGIVRRKFIGAQDWSSPEILDFLSKL